MVISRSNQKVTHITVYLNNRASFRLHQNWMTFALLLNRVGLNLQVACNTLFVMCDTLLVCVYDDRKKK